MIATCPAIDASAVFCGFAEDDLPKDLGLHAVSTGEESRAVFADAPDGTAAVVSPQVPDVLPRLIAIPSDLGFVFPALRYRSYAGNLRGTFLCGGRREEGKRDPGPHFNGNGGGLHSHLLYRRNYRRIS